MKNQVKNNIADAFVALAQKKNIDKITVKDLVDYCDISRQSFYYHFQDILEVIEFLTQRTEREIAMQCQNAASFEDAVRILVNHWIENQNIFENLRDSQKRDFVEQLVMDSLQTHFREAAQNNAANRSLNINSFEADALISFFAFGFAGLMMANYRKKSITADDLSEQIISVFKRLVPNLEER